MDPLRESSYTNEKRWYFLGHQSGRFVRGLTKESNPKQMLKRAGVVYCVAAHFWSCWSFCTQLLGLASAAGRSVVADVKSAGVIGAASGLAKIVYSKYEPAAKGLYTKYEPMSNMQHQLGSL
ncbi:uncharacterized protein LOC107814085 isoform X3 [Nicotiana tabacum]|uniref:Uncharacterized protein LOC107814085 isoform X3 n=1 Tax=Nicotiana tabacum TaxID=4097 RepID=A0AC58UQ09_TOBAC